MRDRRTGWPNIKKQCHEEIQKGGASAAVYEAVFKTIEGPESEGMVEYKKAAKELLQRLLQDEIAQQESDGRVVWPQCKQNKADLATLYVEAVSVKESARTVMNNLHKGSDRWRLEMGPLKKMRCVLQASVPARHLSHHCLPCAWLQSRM